MYFCFRSKWTLQCMPPLVPPCSRTCPFIVPPTTVNTVALPEEDYPPLVKQTHRLLQATREVIALKTAKKLDWNLFHKSSVSNSKLFFEDSSLRYYRMLILLGLCKTEMTSFFDAVNTISHVTIWCMFLRSRTRRYTSEFFSANLLIK